MPISPKQLMVLSHQDFEGYVDVPEKVVDEMNQKLRASCTSNFVVRSKVCREKWLEEYSLSPDAWEYTLGTD